MRQTMLFRRQSLTAAITLSNQWLRLFSSSAAASPRNWTANVFEEGSDGGSAVYNHALKYTRPGTIDLRRERARKFSRPSTMNLLNERLHLRNSISLIGSVEWSPTLSNTSYHGWFVYTLLRVRKSSNPHSSFRIMVVMRDELGKVALQYMQPNDFIYVSGQLESYNKADSQGNSKLWYKVEVKEWNYVKNRPDQEQKIYDEVKESVLQQGESKLTRRKDRLHLWQVFFSNPGKWYDNRKTKKTLRSPDFKHKDTDEALWIHADDPPWIKRQLELNDSRMEAGWQVEESRTSRMTSGWVYDDL